MKYKNEYEPKSRGLTYLRYALASAKRRKAKTMLVPVDKIEDALTQVKINTYKRPKFIEDSNSVQSASIAVCLPASEMVERLNGKLPSAYMQEIAELKTKIVDIEQSLNELTDAISNGDVAMYDLTLLKVRAILRR